MSSYLDILGYRNKSEINAKMLKHCSQTSLNIFTRSSLTLDDLLSTDTQIIEQITDEESDNHASPVLDGSPACQTIRVYTKCLRSDLAYRTLMITPYTTSKEVIMALLNRFRMNHRDPNLFYLTMEVMVDQTLQTIMLDDNSQIVDMIRCNPWGDTGRFNLCSKPGYLLKIYDHNIRTDSVYKAIIISKDTMVRDTITMLETCYTKLGCKNLLLTEYSPGKGSERVLDEREYILDVKNSWGNESDKIFVIKIGNKPTEQETQVDLCETPCLRKGGVSNILRQARRRMIFLNSMLRNEENTTQDEDSFYTARGDVSQEENIAMRNFYSDSMMSTSHDSLSRTHYDSMGSSDQDSITGMEDDSETRIHPDIIKTSDLDGSSLDSVNFNFVSF